MNELKKIQKELEQWIREDISYEEQEHYLQGITILESLEIAISRLNNLLNKR